MKNVISLVSLLFLLTSCAVKYQPYDSFFGGGYRDTQVNSDTFIISFEGNQYSDPGMLYKYSLMRAAEVAQKKGYQYFIVLSDQGFTKTTCTLSTITCQPTVSMTIKAYKTPPTTTDQFYNVDELVALIPRPKK